MTQAALVGIVTLHLLMPAVLDNFPERRQADVDGYIARADCGEMGRRFVLELGGDTFFVAVADCAWPKDAQHIDYVFGGSWLADVDATIWGDLPLYPQQATLTPENVWLARQRQMDRVM